MRRWIWLIVGIVLVAWGLRNAAANLEARGLTIGFEFLTQPANFAIGDTAGLPLRIDRWLRRRHLATIHQSNAHRSHPSLRRDTPQHAIVAPAALSFRA